MPDCRADSFYLAPGALRYFSKNSVFARHPQDGRIVMFHSRKQIHAFLTHNPEWDGLLHVGPPGDTETTRRTLRDRPDLIELHQTSSRIIEGRRPEDPAVYVMHQWASQGVEAAGGARQVAEALLPGASRPAIKAAARLAKAGCLHQLQVMSAAWRSGLVEDTNRLAALLEGTAAFPLPVAPDAALEQVLAHLATLSAAGAEVDIEAVLRSATDPLEVLDPGTVTDILKSDMATPALLHHILDTRRSEHDAGLLSSVAGSRALDGAAEAKLLEFCTTRRRDADDRRSTDEFNSDVRPILLSLASNPATSPALLEEMLSAGVPDSVRMAHPDAKRRDPYVEGSTTGPSLIYLDSRSLAEAAMNNPSAPLHLFYGAEEGEDGVKRLVRLRPTVLDLDRELNERYPYGRKPRSSEWLLVAARKGVGEALLEIEEQNVDLLAREWMALATKLGADEVLRRVAEKEEELADREQASADSAEYGAGTQGGGRHRKHLAGLRTRLESTRASLERMRDEQLRKADARELATGSRDAPQEDLRVDERLLEELKALRRRLGDSRTQLEDMRDGHDKVGSALLASFEAAEALREPVSGSEAFQVALSSSATAELFAAAHVNVLTRNRADREREDEDRRMKDRYRGRSLGSPHITRELAEHAMQVRLEGVSDLSELRYDHPYPIARDIEIPHLRGGLTNPALSGDFAQGTAAGAVGRMRERGAAPGEADLLSLQPLRDRRALAAAVASGRLDADTTREAVSAGVSEYRALAESQDAAARLEGAAFLASLVASPHVSADDALRACGAAAAAPRRGETLPSRTSSSDAALDSSTSRSGAAAAGEREPEEDDRHTRDRYRMGRDMDGHVTLYDHAVGAGSRKTLEMLAKDVSYDSIEARWNARERFQELSEAAEYAAAGTARQSERPEGQGDAQAERLTPENLNVLMQVAARADLTAEQAAQVVTLSGEDVLVVRAARAAGHQLPPQMLERANSAQEKMLRADTRERHLNELQMDQLRHREPLTVPRASEMLAAAAVVGAEGLRGQRIDSAESLNLSNQVKILSAQQRRDAAKVVGEKNGYTVSVPQTRGEVKARGLYMGNCLNGYTGGVERGTDLLFTVSAADGTPYDVRLEHPDKAALQGDPDASPRAGSGWRIGEINNRFNKAGPGGESLDPTVRREISDLFSVLLHPTLPKIRRREAVGAGALR